MSLEEGESFTSDQFASAIKSCMRSRAYGPDSLSIFHLKNLGPLSIEHLTTLYNDSLKSGRRPSIWKTSLVIPIPKPARTHRKAHPTDPSRCYAQQPRSSINEFLSPAKDQTALDPNTRLHLPSSSSQQTCCCCCCLPRPGPSSSQSRFPLWI